MQSHVPGEKKKKDDTICELAVLSVQVIGRERETFANIYQLVCSFLCQGMRYRIDLSISFSGGCLKPSFIK